MHLWLALALAVCAAVARPAAADPAVLELTGPELRAAVDDGGKVMLVDFYAPWCGSCKKLSPLLDQLAAERGDSLRVAKVDATQHPDLATEHEVTSFPKIRYFLGGKAYDYAGARTVEEFALFATRLELDSILAVSSESELRGMLDEHGVVILLSMAPESRDALEGAFVRVAEEYRGVVRLLRWTGTLPADAAAVSVEKLERGLDFRVPFIAPQDVAWNTEALTRHLHDFVAFHGRPFVSVIDAKNFKTLGQLGKNFLIAVLDMSGEDGDARHSKELSDLRQAASAVHGDIERELVIGVLDAVKHSKYLKKYGATAPSLLTVNMDSDSFFLFHESDGVFSGETALSEALVRASRLQPHTDEDTDADEGSVQQLRMKSLHQHLRKPTVAERVRRKFADYFPYSIGICALPFIFLTISLFMTNPRHTKAKKH